VKITQTPLYPTRAASSSDSSVLTKVSRLEARGKFLYKGHQKVALRGVTYGTFARDANGGEYGTPATCSRDFTAMAASGINAVRTYTVPPRWLLDLAARHDLMVMIGLPWEQHVAFLDDRDRLRTIHSRVREGVRSCAGHPAIAGFAVGNEIPASIVRWYGRRRCERHLKQLCETVKSEDPTALVTYVNYPTTEYLELPFLDMACFNVFLEARRDLDAYLARLQNLSGDRPLVLTEIGLDSRRNGEQAQADTIAWQIQTAFQGGCAGAFVFSWTDEWSRGGHNIEDWDFGLTRRDRSPKPALESARKAFAQVPHPPARSWPKISVVVCSYNGSATIGETLRHVRALDYPEFETIVVDDGSTDNVSEIAQEVGVTRLIRVKNGGLSRARNLGMKAASGEIVAYIDDDAYPDPHWLQHLAHTFMTTDFAAVGGPNLPPPGDGWIADCVANSPGGPTHVLFSDRQAEHIPGCNMAFRKTSLEAIGGFDSQFRVAGDDVDVCWALQRCGWKLGFNPAAVVWHHRRNSIRAYWKQQKGYGNAEALLERKWPEKYNIIGHLTWNGRLYGRGHSWAFVRRGRIYHGVWGSAPFQTRQHRTPGVLESLCLMPEWVMVIAGLAALSALGFVWKPLLAAAPLFVLAAAIPFVQALLSTLQPELLHRPGAALWPRLRHRSVIVMLHVLQPIARLWGRLHNGITPWRSRGDVHYAVPRPRTMTVWSEDWRSQEDWLGSVEAAMKSTKLPTLRGGGCDRWELEGFGGILGGVRLRMALEEHGAGKQLARFKVWPKASLLASTLVSAFGALTILAGMSHATIAAIVLGVITLAVAFTALDQCGSGMGCCLQAIARQEKQETPANEADCENAEPELSWTDHLRASPRTAFSGFKAGLRTNGNRNWAISSLIAPAPPVRPGRPS
jgi:GT2 family glycosyltransferase